MHAGHAKVSLGTCMQAMQRFHWAQAGWSSKGFTGHMHASHAKVSLRNARWPCKGFTGRKHAGQAKVSLGTCTLATQRFHCARHASFTRRMHAGQAKFTCNGKTGNIIKTTLAEFVSAFEEGKYFLENLKWLNNITQNQPETPLPDCVE
jgi:hypothetical protein